MERIIYPIPNSSMLVFPVIIAPAACSFSTTVAEYGLVKPWRILEAHVVCRSVVHMLSLTAINFPWRPPLSYSRGVRFRRDTLSAKGTNRKDCNQWHLSEQYGHLLI